MELFRNGNIFYSQFQYIFNTNNILDGGTCLFSPFSWVADFVMEFRLMPNKNSTLTHHVPYDAIYIYNVMANVFVN